MVRTFGRECCVLRARRSERMYGNIAMCAAPKAYRGDAVAWLDAGHLRTGYPAASRSSIVRDPF